MPPKKKPSKEYPASYFKVLEAFGEGRDGVSVDMTYREAVSRRHHFYRFFGSLAEEYNKDDYTRRLSDTANTVVISISPSKARDNDPVTITFSINPIELAMMDDIPKREETLLTPSEEAYDPSEIERLIAEKHEGEGE